MVSPSSIEAFLDRVAAATRREPVSEAKRLGLASGEAVVVTVVEGDDVVALGIGAPHRQPDGRTHWAIETAVRPDLAFVDFEASVLRSILDDVPGRDVSVWSTRSTSNEALVRLGFVETRRLLHMVIDPIGSDSTLDADIRPFADDDLDALLAVNGAAFADHREAASLDRAGFEELRGQAWFDPHGIVVATSGGNVIGFCWTKVHPNGDGEIYRIAVDPAEHGRGWGRRLVTAGFGHLASDPSVRRGTLWVEATNVGAVRLYESIGLEPVSANVEFERQPNR